MVIIVISDSLADRHAHTLDRPRCRDPCISTRDFKLACDPPTYYLRFTVATVTVVDPTPIERRVCPSLCSMIRYERSRLPARDNNSRSRPRVLSSQAQRQEVPQSTRQMHELLLEMIHAIPAVGEPGPSYIEAA